MSNIPLDKSPTPATFATLGEPVSPAATHNGQPASDVSGTQTFWDTRQIVLATLTVVGVACLFLLLYRFYMVVFIFFVAITLQIAIRPVVGWLQRRWQIRPEIGVVIVYVILFLLLLLGIWFLTPLLLEQVNTLSAQIPAYYDLIRTWLVESPSRIFQGLARVLPAQPAQLTALLTETPSAASPTTSTWQTVSNVFYTLFVFLVILMLAFFWTREGEVITRRLILLVPMERRDEVRLILAEMENKVGAYFRGQIILCVIIGVLSLVAYLLIGVPYAFLLSLLMGIFEAVPMVGPLLGAIPAVFMTLTVAPDKVLWVIAAIALIQVLENNLLVPRVMDQSVGVNALVTILAIAAFGLLFGLVGAILAIPLAAMLQILLNRVLFHEILPEETPKPPIDTSAVGRSQVSVLRLEAQALIQDVRKQVRTGADEAGEEADTERAQELIEAIAEDLDSLLAAKETAR